jgi:hypothetical protein
MHEVQVFSLAYAFSHINKIRDSVLQAHMYGFFNTIQIFIQEISVEFSFSLYCLPKLELLFWHVT